MEVYSSSTSQLVALIIQGS